MFVKPIAIFMYFSELKVNIQAVYCKLDYYKVDEVVYRRAAWG